MALVELPTTRLSPSEAVLSQQEILPGSPSLFSETTPSLSNLTSASADLSRVIRLANYLDKLFNQDKENHSTVAISEEFLDLSTRLSEMHERMFPYFQVMHLNPAESVATLFGTEVNNTPDISMYPMAIVIRMEGYDYGRIADMYCRNPCDPKSYGTTASFHFLPEPPRGRLLLINEGDGYYGVRSEAEINKTEKHELIHALFNTCFIRSPLFTTDEMNVALSQLNDPTSLDCHNQISKSLLDSMSESARSEVIAYFSTGDTELVLQNVGAHWWNEHFTALEKFLRENIENDTTAKSIYDIYVNAEQHFLNSLRNYAYYARELYRSSERSDCLNNLQVTALLLECGLDEYQKLMNLADIPGLKAA